MWQQICHI